ncbi:MAG TPA: hypothetical protein VK191_16840 [Symbiobacteriaceae bacterium]|nr:hypothetical protein [Symbiobacteriaceae bacterium]
MAEKYYSTSRVLRTGTTSTLALMIWKVLSDALELQNEPVTGTEMAAKIGLPLEQLDVLFSSTYYQKHYGFARFDSRADWESWAKGTGVLFNPELHTPKAEEPAEAAAE